MIEKEAISAARSESVSVVIVNYNRREWLRACLQSVINGARDTAIEVIVVDNASCDGAPSMVSREFPEVRLVCNTSNRGFAAATNQGISHAGGGYVFLLNPDTLVARGSVGELCRFLDQHPEVGLVGPKLTDCDGALQHSIRNFPTLCNQAFEGLMLHRILPEATERLGEVVTSGRSYRETRQVDWLCGAALLARREMIESVGDLDEAFFLYAEEKDWCYRAAKEGWKTYYHPHAEVVHRGGQSGEDPDLFVQLMDSRARFVRKHYSRSTAAVIRAVNDVRVLSRFLVWGLRAALLQSPRAVKRSGVYWAALRRKPGVCLQRGSS